MRCIDKFYFIKKKLLVKPLHDKKNIKHNESAFNINDMFIAVLFNELMM